MNVRDVQWPVGKLAGVIDLAAGMAVHAIAGERAKYRPVASCDGDPVTLVNQYRAFGIQSLYIADLDAISGQPLQTALLDEMAAGSQGDVLVDPGWSGGEQEVQFDAINSLVETHARVAVIAATETASCPESMERLAERIPVEKICLGLDFRQRQLLVSKALRECSVGKTDRASRGAFGSTPAHDAGANAWHDGGFSVSPWRWIDTALALGIQRFVVLDVATVGKSRGPATLELCREIKRSNPQLSIWSGGGIRNASDAHELVQHGCDYCLIATALHGLL